MNPDEVWKCHVMKYSTINGDLYCDKSDISVDEISTVSLCVYWNETSYLL